jgi:membrane-bound lytic murein transglycosylase B
MRTIKGLFIALALTAAAGATPAYAVKCGNNASGYEAWKQAFAAEAKANGINNKAISALMATSYASKTIHADRNQKSFKLSYEKFKQVRGTATIVKMGKGLKKKHAAMFQKIEAKYGVPAGPLIAIWGMETAFGKFTGNQNVLAAVATLAYDCRRSDSASAKGAMHGELGQTQFMPKAIALYAVGDLNSREGALASTANFLKAHGWRRGAGYLPGQPNYAAIQGWNAASVYQRAIAEMGAQIDAN